MAMRTTSWVRFAFTEMYDTLSAAFRHGRTSSRGGHGSETATLAQNNSLRILDNGTVLE